MKKRLLPLLLLMAFALTACAQTARAPGPSAPDASPSPTATQDAGQGENYLFWEDETPAYLTCRIVDAAETGDLLLAGEDGEIYTLPFEDTFKEDGGSVIYTGGTSSLPDAFPLRDGMTVTVAYNGDLMETWPAQFGEVYSLTVSDDPVDDRCGLYLQVLEDLWNTDPGLNSDGDLKYLGMDLSGLTHLTAGEKAAVIWRFSNDHGLTPMEGTWEELCDQGYIDRENLCWEDGIFFSIDTDEDAVWSLPALGPGDEMPALTAFNAQKWRSGLGAYFFNDCVGQRQANGSWTYSVGSEAIS